MYCFPVKYLKNVILGLIIFFIFVSFSIYYFNKSSRASSIKYSNLPSPTPKFPSRKILSPTNKIYSAKKILVLGDSLSVENIYQAKIKELSNNKFSIYTDAKIGRATGNVKYEPTGNGILYRLINEPSLQDLSTYTDAIVFAGVNDFGVCNSKYCNPPTIDNLGKIYQILKNKGLKVTAVTILPFKEYTGFTWTDKMAQAFTNTNNWILNKSNANCTVNTLNKFKSPSDLYALNSRCNSGDNLHPNRSCLEELGQLIYQACFKN